MFFFKNLLAFLAFSQTIAFGGILEQQRADFSQAEKLLQQNNIAAFLQHSATLSDYPLYPYLQYQWLKNQLQNTGQIQAFIRDNPNDYYAALLRTKWLDHLAKQGQWDGFSNYYQADKNISGQCLFYWAKYMTGKAPLASDEIKHLWATATSAPKECNLPFLGLILSPGFNSGLAWHRFELALSNNDIVQAGQLLRLLPISEQKIARLWLHVHKKPDLVLEDAILPIENQKTGRIFAYGIAKLAQTNLDLAITTWHKRKPSLAIDPEIAQQTERKLALALAYRHDSRAYQQLANLQTHDDKTIEWKIRSALWEQDWQHANEALSELTAEQQQQPVWQYWQARCHAMLGNKTKAQAIYEKLAEDRSFYGFLAAELTGKPYNLADKPITVSEQNLSSLTSAKDFRAIQELNFLNRGPEARRLWLFTMDKLDKEQAKVAAKLAQQWGWDQIAILTLTKADYWDDIGLRFPLRHTGQIELNAKNLPLDASIIFGLIRQESMLQTDAVSAAGAKGLMQLMPATAKLIAGKLHEPWLSENTLFDPAINIRYGSNYFKQLLNHFKNNMALAISAYNAGPNRVTKWLPKTHALSADIWVESIPYEETRKYVTTVLFYTMVYQIRTNKNTLKLKELLSDIHSD